MFKGLVAGVLVGDSSASFIRLVLAKVFPFSF